MSEEKPRRRKLSRDAHKKILFPITLVVFLGVLLSCSSFTEIGWFMSIVLASAFAGLVTSIYAFAVGRLDLLD